MAEFQAWLPEFVAGARTEPGCLYFDFTANGDVVHCREAYDGGAAALDHIVGVRPLLEKIAPISDVLRFEIHGAEEELAHMRPALAGRPIDWYVLVAALEQ